MFISKFILIVYTASLADNVSIAQLMQGKPHAYPTVHKTHSRSSHYPLIQSTIAPVTRIFASTNGSKTFQPVSINWSYRGRGSDARSSIKKKMNANVFIKNHAHDGRKSGPSQPPKNIVAVIACEHYDNRSNSALDERIR